MCDCAKIVETAKQFVVAATNHVMNGGPTTKEEAERRMSICQECEMFNNGFCGECYCFLPIKTSWKEQDCPLGKWPKIQ